MNDSGLKPTAFCVLIELDTIQEKTPGGIILPSKVQDQDKLSVQEGTLIAVSPQAFTYAENWPEGTVPQLGQRVLFKRYDGMIHDRNGKSYRLVEDKSIVAIVEPPVVDDSGFSAMPGGAWIRCMGGKFCNHAPATCTASPEYQAGVKAQIHERAA
jgi:co-chaperonin GroES (HSP10)